MKQSRAIAAGVFFLLMLASPAMASEGHVNQSQSLSLTLQGMIVNAGNQHYELGGGTLVQGSVFGHDVSSASIKFGLDASVHGLGASGSGSIQISSASKGGDNSGGGNGGQNNGKGQGGHGSHSNGFGFNARITITGAIPAAIFPLTLESSTTYVNCDPSTQSCNSEIPLFFTGVATFESQGSKGPTQIPIAIESPYWNPFGHPIVITSLDSTSAPSIFLVVTYDRATIGWDGVQLQGMLMGAFGGQHVSGAFGQTVNSQENLMLGKEQDGGTIAFVAMSPDKLNANGRFSGLTSFSLEGSFDCAPQFTLPEGTCTATGAGSDGSFKMSGGQGTQIAGTYHTDWSVPSLFTLTTVMGAVTQG